MTTLIFDNNSHLSEALTRLLLSTSSTEAPRKKKATVYAVPSAGSQAKSVEANGASALIFDTETATIAELVVTLTTTGTDAIIWCPYIVPREQGSGVQIGKIGEGLGGGVEPDALGSAHALSFARTVKVMDAASQAGVRRFVIVSIGDWDRLEAWKGSKLEAGQHPFLAERDMLADNQRRSLDWTIVCTRAVDGQGWCQSAARAIVECLRDRRSVGMIVSADDYPPTQGQVLGTGAVQ